MGRQLTWCCLSALTSLLIAVPATASAQAPGDRAALLQAAFLYRLVDFVDWPVSATRDDGILRVGILGEDPFGRILDEVLSEPERDGSVFEILRSNEADSLRSCHLVFIAITDSAGLSNAFSTLREEPVLIVGHQSGFAERGGHVNFYIDTGRLRFEVNLEAVQDSGLRMSSRLLALARIVETPSR